MGLRQSIENEISAQTAKLAQQAAELEIDPAQYETLVRSLLDDRMRSYHLTA